ncbi:sialate O-acetylesterase [Phenylobacterium sp.]|uniref:sialate O-acetylesterase n=1 Tax=Phenylobacterium sp. TaxID=1871053 RepID=UPI002F93E097
MTELVVVAGQSNALGYQVSPSELPAWYQPTAQVQIWTDAGWRTLTPGVNTGTPANPNAWGPEVAFAHAWVQEHPGETLYIVKSVKGSTPLADAPGEDWSPRSDGSLFDATTAKVAAARAALGGAVSTTVLWFQGEQDASSPAWADAYAANLAELQAAAAQEWGASRFLMGRIDTDYGANATVQQAQGPGFNTDEFLKQGDNLHLTGQAQIDSGFSFYSLYDDTPLQVAFGTAGNDRYIGSTGADSVAAQGGDDLLYGGAGADWFHGNTGADTLYAGSGADVVYGGQQDDRISLDDGDDFGQGNLGADTLAGGWGADSLYGGQGADLIGGGKGNDFIAGDRGTDTLSGGEGADRFYFFWAADNDVVADFDGAAGDRILLEPGTGWALTEAAGDTVILFTAGSVTLDGVALSTFDPAWIT